MTTDKTTGQIEERQLIDAPLKENPRVLYVDLTQLDLLVSDFPDLNSGKISYEEHCRKRDEAKRVVLQQVKDTLRSEITNNSNRLYAVIITAFGSQEGLIEEKDGEVEQLIASIPSIKLIGTMYHAAKTVQIPTLEGSNRDIEYINPRNVYADSEMSLRELIRRKVFLEDGWRSSDISARREVSSEMNQRISSLEGLFI